MKPTLHRYTSFCRSLFCNCEWIQILCLTRYLPLAHRARSISWKVSISRLIRSWWFTHNCWSKPSLPSSKSELVRPFACFSTQTGTLGFRILRLELQQLEELKAGLWKSKICLREWASRTLVKIPRLKIMPRQLSRQGSLPTYHAKWNRENPPNKSVLMVGKLLLN